MDGPIYRLWMIRDHTEAKRQLSKEEWADFKAKRDAILEEVGGKRIVISYSRWSGEFMAFGVTQYPDFEALRECIDRWNKMDFFRYYDAVSLLGSEWRPPT